MTLHLIIILSTLSTMALSAATSQQQQIQEQHIMTLENCQEHQTCQWIKSSTPIEIVHSIIKANENNGLFSVSDQKKPENPIPVWDDDKIRNENNCYNFAMDIVTNSFARPGSATLQRATDFSYCNALVEGAVKDGLVKVNKEQVGDYSGNNWSCRYVALAITNPDKVARRDFHWFRLMRTQVEEAANKDNEEIWYHKPGSLNVRRRDFNGTKIPKHGLEKADRGPYEIMCGYFKNCVMIQ